MKCSEWGFEKYLVCAAPAYEAIRDCMWLRALARVGATDLIVLRKIDTVMEVQTTARPRGAAGRVTPVAIWLPYVPYRMKAIHACDEQKGVCC